MEIMRIYTNRNLVGNGANADHHVEAGIEPDAIHRGQVGDMAEADHGGQGGDMAEAEADHCGQGGDMAEADHVGQGGDIVEADHRSEEAGNGAEATIGLYFEHGADDVDHQLPMGNGTEAEVGITNDAIEERPCNSSNSERGIAYSMVSEFIVY